MKRILSFMIIGIMAFSLAACGNSDAGNTARQEAENMPEMSDNTRPEIAGTVEHMEGYDIVFVAYPNWLAYHNLLQCTQV